MITPEDIAFMKQTRKEIVAGRVIDVVLTYEPEGERDPITNEPIGGGEHLLPTKAVVTEVSSMAQSSFERLLDAGILVEKGDIWASVDIDEIADVFNSLVRIKYDGQEYEVMAKDKKGIGERNRAEFVGRLIS
ncbi:hypothetical protein [Cytobacillus purgationiresistens]|uniref:Uncharacterized protein n=1 Tax=Cytobacillus purgationiresistens TaxID=863449 RepID=A0ABU0AL06_9BACI|nr:hypothetical protein [Cytobacillus purgationiresistens]MDQ0270725.1 hypothetical protein [Cytobacillus purgationiresistens]